MSNLPDGVTGREFAINGWDVERNERQHCPVCKQYRDGMLLIYGDDAQWDCDFCEETTMEWNAREEYEDDRADWGYDDLRDRRDEEAC